MNIIVAITGASGAIYARQALTLLAQHPDVEKIALILSDHAKDVIAAENETIPFVEHIIRYDNDDMWASVASGSAEWDSMIVVPASMGCVGRIASGISRKLIERAADVMLKERKPLVMVVREAPYSLIHLRNLTTLTEAGAIVIPASPSFYLHPASIEELCLTISQRAVEFTGLHIEHKRWGEK